MLADLGDGLSIHDVLQRHCGSLHALDQEFELYARDLAERLAPDATWEAVELAKDASAADLAGFLVQHPRNFAALRRYARQLMDEHRSEEARLPLEKMLELYPDYVGPDNAYRPLADMYRESGDTQKERELLASLAARKGDAVDVYPRLMELAPRLATGRACEPPPCRCWPSIPWCQRRIATWRKRPNNFMTLKKPCAAIWRWPTWTRRTPPTCTSGWRGTCTC